MKELSEKELINKAECYCIQAERCCSEVCRKLMVWGASEIQSASIVAHLLQERFIDEARFAVAFSGDKMRYSHWGRVKIGYALKEKELSQEHIRNALAQLDPEEYAEILQKTLKEKWTQVKGKNDYECRQKVIRFALGRGFAMQEILNALDALGRGGDDEY